jgi:hypothetical protein
MLRTILSDRCRSETQHVIGGVASFLATKSSWPSIEKNAHDVNFSFSGWMRNATDTEPEAIVEQRSSIQTRNDKEEKEYHFAKVSQRAEHHIVDFRKRRRRPVIDNTINSQNNNDINDSNIIENHGVHLQPSLFTWTGHLSRQTHEQIILEQAFSVLLSAAAANSEIQAL